GTSAGGAAIIVAARTTGLVAKGPFLERLLVAEALLFTKRLLVAERLAAAGRARRALAKGAGGLVVGVAAGEGFGAALGDEFLRRSALLVEMDAAGRRSIFVVAGFVAPGRRLAAVEAARPILAGALRAQFFLGLFGAVGEAETLAGDFDRVGAAAGQAV